MYEALSLGRFRQQALCSMGPIEGAERVARFLIGALRSVDFEAKTVWLNGSPGGRIDIGGEVEAALSFSVENGRITCISAIRNPQSAQAGPARRGRRTHTVLIREGGETMQPRIARTALLVPDAMQALQALGQVRDERR